MLSDKHYVVDGDRNADIYGIADNPRAALQIARACFADQVSHVELYGPINLIGGDTLPLAYVAFTVTQDTGKGK